MKIVRITNFLDFGGVEKHFELIGLHNETDSYEFIALGTGGKTEERLLEEGYPVHCLDESPKIPNLTLIFKLYRLLKSIKPDVVHASAAESNFHGTIAAFLGGVPLRIAEEIGIPNHSKAARLVFRFTYMFAHKVVGVSKAVSDYLISIKEITPDKSVSIYNPVHINQSKTPSIKDSGVFTIVTVCRIDPIKNLDFLIMGIFDLRKIGLDVEVVIVGDGPDRKRLENLANELEILDFVRFVGFQSNPEDFLISADLFVLPSLSEGFAIALVEAMLLGVPSMSTNVGGPKEIIDHENTGWLFDPANYESFLALLKGVVQLSKEDRKMIAKSGKLYAESTFTPKIYLDKVHSLYHRLLKNGE